ncbi:Anti-sigma-V factor RsiV [bioreactor metagenome]|uniref:Anti-sigma-V factor RsiV n=1 Tax=bioreactor metagenome TaxID=1076179 RepID=A0A645FSK0_9ZZZZ
MFYYNYDLTTSQPLTLRDMLGSDYIDIANKQIKEKIAERAKNPDNMYWSENEGGFTSIRDTQQFYVNKKGNPVIIFNKYEIAPGYMGIQEFEITK